MSTKALTSVHVLTSESTRGALAVVRIIGPDALAVADAVFRPARGRALADSPPDRPRFGRVGTGIGDEVVAVVIGGEGSDVEIHCHGGPEPLALVLDALVAAGAERGQPGEWARLDSKAVEEYEARLQLAHAPTLRVAEILLEQAQGALRREMRGIDRALRSEGHRAAIEAIDRVLARAEFGRRLIAGWTVALAGRPNVGKSRLLNALAGYHRAIVDPSPGTTRDVVTVRTALDGWPVEIADTAGLRTSGDVLERAGIDLAHARHADADLTILLLDRSEPLTEDDLALKAALAARGALVIASKGDLPAAWDPEPEGLLTVSAERGDGMGQLIAAVARRLVPDPPPAGAGVPFCATGVRELEDLRRALVEQTAPTGAGPP